jgi:hypothetical protein
VFHARSETLHFLAKRLLLQRLTGKAITVPIITADTTDHAKDLGKREKNATKRVEKFPRSLF